MGSLILINNVTIGRLIMFFSLVLGTTWLLWCVWAAILACPPLIMCMRPRYNRLSIDSNNKRGSGDTHDTGHNSEDVQPLLNGTQAFI